MGQSDLGEIAMMEWGQAGNLIWFWTVPAAAGLFLLARWRRTWQARRFGEAALVERLVVSLDRRKRLIKRALWLSALACMVLALGQPHFRKKETRVERKGIDVLIALDVSQSMMAKDIAPNRLEKAKLELRSLIDALKGDRVGIIAFAGEALIQCPLTTDKGAAKLFLSTANPNLIPFQGTSLKSAVAAAIQAFGDRDKDAKALILLTDGEDHDKETMAAARRAKDLGIRIYTIGIGTPEGSPVPDEFGRGVKKDRSGQIVLSRLGEPVLRDLARATGGLYFRSSRGELEVENLLREIRQFKQKGLGSRWSVEYEENFQLFVLLALALLCLEMILSERGRTT